jgi:oxygen-dependent protoporphyrinogen oxidase
LAKALGPSLRLGARVRSITSRSEGDYRVNLEAGDSIEAATVVLACPAWNAAEIMLDTDAEISAAMASIPTAPLAVVHMGFDARDLPREPAGFGFLVPRGQGPRVLGTLWASSIFPDRAPAGSILLTSMLGGARDPGAASLGDDEALATVRADLRTTMGIEAAPRFTRIVRHRRGIPQYELGHAERVRRIEARLRAYPGLFVCGNSYRGVAVNACIEGARPVADAVLKR